jgi:hypothetical protein
LVSDSQWQAWANELVKLQKRYPHIAERVDYHNDFVTFDGTTGFDLPTERPEITQKAEALIKYHYHHFIRVDFSRAGK